MSDDGVTYSFKDLFEKLEDALTKGFDKIDKRVDQLNLRLDAKADNSTVASLAAKVAQNEIRTEERFTKFSEAIDNRFKPLELMSAGTTAVSTFQRWALGTVGVGVLSAIATLVWLAAGGH